MINTSESLSKKLNERIRDNVSFEVQCIPEDNTSIFDYILDEFWDKDISNIDFSTGSNDKYAATFSNNGFCIGDTNCVVTDSGVENLAVQSKPSSANRVIPFLSNVNASLSEFSIQFINDRPLSMYIVGMDSSSNLYRLELDDEEYHNISLFIEEHNIVDYTVMFETEAYKTYKVSLTVFGEAFIFNEDKVITSTQTMYTDLVSATIPTNNITVNIEDFDGKFDPTNPDGKYDSIYRGKKVIVKYGIKGDMVKRGALYIDDVPTYDNNILTIKAVSYLELKTNNVTTGGSLSTKMPAGADVYEYDLTDDYLGIICDFDIDELKTNSVVTMPVKEVVQLVGNAGVMFGVCDDYRVVFKSSVDRIKNANTVYHLSADDMKLKYPTVRMRNNVSSIKYDVSSNKVSDTVEKYDIIGTSGTTVNINEQYNDAVNIDIENVPSSVTATLNKRFVTPDNECVFSVSFSETAIPLHFECWANIRRIDKKPISNSNVKTTFVYNEVGDVLPINNPLLSDKSDLRKHADSMYEIYKNRQLFEIEYSQDYRLELGDVITIDTKYERNVKLIITELTFVVPGRFGKLVGLRID